MTGCCAVGCINRDSKSFLMERFPRDPERRKIWAAKVRRENWTPTNSSFPCEVLVVDNAGTRGTLAFTSSSSSSGRPSPTLLPRTKCSGLKRRIAQYSRVFKIQAFDKQT